MLILNLKELQTPVHRALSSCQRITIIRPTHPLYVIFKRSLADLLGGGASRLPPFGQRTEAVTHRTPDNYVTTVQLYGDTIASLSLQTHKTWYSEYSKLLPPCSGFLTDLECTEFVFDLG